MGKSRQYRTVRVPLDHPLAGKSGAVGEHRLVVWNAGVDPRGKVVHHRNNDPKDNRIENLQVLSYGEHAKKHVEDRPRGETHGCAKLTDALVLELLRLRYETGVSQYKLARVFGISQVMAGEIIRRDSWGHLEVPTPKFLRKPRRGSKGSKNGSAKLTESDVIEVRRRKKNGKSTTLLAKEYGLAFQSMWRIVTRRTWKHVTDQ